MEEGKKKEERGKRREERGGREKEEEGVGRAAFAFVPNLAIEGSYVRAELPTLALCDSTICRYFALSSDDDAFCLRYRAPPVPTFAEPHFLHVSRMWFFCVSISSMVKLHCSHSRPSDVLGIVR